MEDRQFLTARIDSDGESEMSADQRCVPWWSFTKTVLATAALQLVARGQLTLDGPTDGKPYTLRQLLQHRAGVPNYGRLESYHQAVRRGDKPWSVEQLLDRVTAERLDFEPGHGWRYSNVGYLFVRQIIEEVTGQDIGNALRSLVFDALGLDSAYLAKNAVDLDDTAWGNRGQYDPGWVYHGLLVGTPGDAVRFLHRLMVGDVLPRELLTEMQTRLAITGRLPGRPWATLGYGLGLMIGEMDRAGMAMGHAGGGPGSVSAIYHFGDQTPPCTVGTFTQSDDDGIVEHQAVRLARPT